jgi:DNA-binding CsgD family transcriptional regulator
MENRLTWRDARAVFGLVDDVRRLGRDPFVWRRHLLTELGVLVDAPVGLAGETPLGEFLAPSSHVATVDTGWATDSDRSVWMRACERTEVDLDPCDATVARLGPRSFTRPRAALASDRAWYASMIFNEHYKPAGVDHCLLSHFALVNEGLLHYVLLFKAKGSPPFTEKERRLVHHVHRELGAAWAVSDVGLSRRLRQTLDLLHAGRGEKEIADILGIRRQTVHDYCKVLHKRFNAHSRGELLAATALSPRSPTLALRERRMGRRR